MNSTQRPIPISAAFIADREGRGLDCGSPSDVRVRSGKVAVQADAATLSDMIEDAAFQGWHTDADLAIRNAAQAAFRDLVLAGVPYSKGTRLRGGRPTPGDAA